MGVIVVDLMPKGDKPKEQHWADIQEMMDELAEATNREIAALMVNLNISQACATDVWYLRTRSRHTPELELELVRLHKEGTPPNICDWP